MRVTQVSFALGLLCAPLMITACDDDEAASEQHGTPVDARPFVNGTDVSAGLALAAGETVRAEMKFYDGQGAEITGIEDEHFATVTVTPASLVTVADVSGKRFQKDLTASAEQGSGTFRIGYGHDEAADETEFGPFDVVVAVPAFVPIGVGR
ncbi:MAG: hypothetical protein H0W67_00765 [Gemmatimonadales bacterium]|nr:hypothetical protein [Gemmatimonadales bacterium]